MRRRLGSVTLAVAAALAVAAPAQAAKDPLNAYRVKPTAENKQQLAAAGFDLTEGDRGKYIEIFATRAQARELAADGVAAQQVTRNAATAAEAPPYSGSDADWTVWTRHDAVPADGKEQYVEQYDRLDDLDIVERESLGKSHLGRDIWALKVTRNAKTTPDNARPAVLYNALQHAREWLAGETCRRTLEYFTGNYGSDPHVTRLVNTRELWFVCVANPDGYEYTFTEGNRLWRKNMADNNGDGLRGEPGDGVDPNRNFATNWGRDNEGSSSDPASETYRGPAPDSEPETKAMKGLWNRVDFQFQKNDHTAAELLLYPQGFQQYTPTPDNGIFEALAGNDAESAIADKVWDAAHQEWDITGNRFDPDISAELYITNGDTLDDAYHEHGILGFTPEGSEPDTPNVSGFEFEDDEGRIEAEFQRHRLFALDLAESADDPENPESHMGNTVQDFYVQAFADSYGDPQPVEVSAKRSLGDVRLMYRINNGSTHRAPTKEAPGGERFNNDAGVYYQRLRGEVHGTEPGDVVKVWFEGGGRTSKSFTYTARSESGNEVLVMAAENYTAGAPAQDPNGPHYLAYYTSALDALGVKYDVYDVDRMGNRSPDSLGVLDHYDAVIWYTGDDLLVRQPGQPGGTGTARLAVEQMIDVRAFLNEGGKVLYTGKDAGTQFGYTAPANQQFRNFGFPEPWESPQGKWCSTDPADEFNEDNPALADGCIQHNDDFLQYYLGAYIRSSPGNAFDDVNHRPYPLAGTPGGPFEGLSWLFDESGAGNQDHAWTFVITSSILPPAQYPLYASSRKAADWLREGAAPFSPFSGTQYMAAGADNRGYKRLTRTVDLSAAASPQMAFKFSADLELDWDFFAVEARTPGGTDWTTLPELDTDGAGPDTALTTDETGESCAEGLATDTDAPHPFLQAYWNADCTPKDGKWNAYTGSTGGWTDFTVDLSQFAGQQVELSLTVITDWGTLGLGTWVDDVTIADGGNTLAATDFEPDAGGWAVSDPPEGSDPLSRNWTRRGQEFEEGGVVTTDDSVYASFGFEGMNATARPEWMKRALQHLGVVKDNPGQGNPVPGQPGGNSPNTPAAGQPGGSSPNTPAATKRASAKLKIGKRLRADRRRRVKLRVVCEGDAGAMCDGKAALKRRGRTLGSKSFTTAAGTAKTVTVKLKRSSFRKLQRAGSRRANAVVSGTDGSRSKLAAKQAVRLLKAKKKT
jgi:hypothetical protein